MGRDGDAVALQITVVPAPPVNEASLILDARVLCDQLKSTTLESTMSLERLRMNQERLVVARALWVKAHCHPPSFDA